MKKLTLKKKINEIAKYLKSENAKEAIIKLHGELEDYIEAKEVVSTKQGFPLPEDIKRKSNAIALFTDGACRGNPGPGSYAYMAQNNLEDIVVQFAQHEEYTTNNKMELTAIIKGLEFLYSELSPMHEIFIYTDSKYVVDGMNSWVANWKKRGWKKADKKAPENVELWKELDSFAQKMNCNFLWVKGHSGHPQNEFVDQLANQVLDENGF